MPPAREATGQPASDGLYAGPVLRLGMASGRHRRHSGSDHGERVALQAALDVSRGEIEALMAAAEGDAADILAFQVAMIEDEALSTPAYAAIRDGVAADIAWAAALDGEIAGYAASDNDYFRARASDLRDIRDRVLAHLTGATRHGPAQGMVLLGDDLAPTRFLETDWSRGGAIALTGGSASSHVAMLARARGVPMVVGLSGDVVDDAREAMVDGGTGHVILNPTAVERTAFAARQADMARTRDAEQAYLLRDARLAGGARVEVLVNIAGLEELAHLDPQSCDGIGLMRSEFLFRDGAPLPDEEQQYRVYRQMLEWAGPRPVTIRTLDIGGDKPIAGLTPEGERNPFLGLRGIRLMLARPEVFRTQLRALARAACHGTLKLMIPMVTVPDELSRSAALLDACCAELAAEGRAHARPPLGIMVEVPSVAITPERFAAAAFFSIGSNDLTQYVTAASRDEGAVAHLNDPADPAVSRLIAGVAAFATAHGIPVSLCGDMASDTARLPGLIGAGLRSLSVAPSRIARVKAALARL